MKKQFLIIIMLFSLITSKAQYNLTGTPNYTIGGASYAGGTGGNITLNGAWYDDALEGGSISINAGKGDYDGTINLNGDTYVKNFSLTQVSIQLDQLRREA
jgi:hypothetical protein